MFRRRLICNNRYEIRRHIRTGGTAYIYTAVDNVSKDWVIVKAPRIDKLTKSMKRLKDESEKLCSLNHNNIVRWLNESEEEDTFYLIEELVRGGRMMEMYERNPPSLTNTYSFAKSLIKTVQYLHRKNPFPIIHGDINPQNIIIKDKEYIPIIIDFGIATRLGSDRQVPSGTRPWSAPEQLDKGTWKPNSDIYALGAILFFLSIGKVPPYQYGGKKKSIEIKHNLQKCDIPSSLVNIILDSLKPNHKERIKNIDELYDRFQSIKIRKKNMSRA